MFTIKFLLLYIACHNFLDPLFQNLGDLDSKAQGLRDMCHQRLIFQNY
jgi:hypothetical protein